MKIKCEYCDSMFDDTLENCPACGAPNANVRRSTSDQPTTIGGLMAWYDSKGLPGPEVTRFFIGQDYRGPRAFGIYKDENSGKFIVYKNKADGSGGEGTASGTDSESSADGTSAAESSETGTPLDNTGYRAIETVSADWTYALRTDVNGERLEKLLDEAKKINRQKYTDESLEKLNHAILVAQKTLCASVFVSQNGIQMMLGGTIGEAYGATLSVGNTIVRGLLTFSLSILPLAAIIALAFDKKKAVKNVVVLICSILAILDIFLSIYPFIGIGAVLAIIIYIIAIMINLGGFYAYRQEKYIVDHPELEAEFTQQHPHLVKALINEKSFGDAEWMDRKAKERAAAQQAKKKMQKKKRSK